MREPPRLAYNRTLNGAGGGVAIVRAAPTPTASQRCHKYDWPVMHSSKCPRIHARTMCDARGRRLVGRFARTLRRTLDAVGCVE